MNHSVNLLNAVTEYDRAQSKKRGYNPYALGHYTRGLGNIRKRVDLGQPLRDAIITEFCGRLCDRLLRSVGLEVMSGREARHGLENKLPALPDDDE